MQQINLTLSRRRWLSYRNQSVDLQYKSMDWFLYDYGLCHECVEEIAFRPGLNLTFRRRPDFETSRMKILKPAVQSLSENKFS